MKTQEKIETFKNLSFDERRKVLLTLLQKLRWVTDFVDQVYSFVSSATADWNDDYFLRIYTALLSSIESYKKWKLDESISKLSDIQKELLEMKQKEKKEREEDDLDGILDNM